MKSGSDRVELSPILRQTLNEAMKNGEQKAPGSTPSKASRVARLVVGVDSLNAIGSSLPDIYHWRFTTAESFGKHFISVAEGGASIEVLNGLYWRDTLATVEAHTVMSVWRMIDIANACLSCIEEDAIIPASILARSALESGIQFVFDARTMSATLEDILKVDLTNQMVSSTELEDLILKTVYATRKSGAEEIYKSRNILTVIDKIAKVAKDDPLKEEYETLCELTHPNFLGRSIYLEGFEEQGRPGDEIRKISHRNGVTAPEILQSTLWALSWATEAQAASTHLIMNVIRDLMEKFPFLMAVRK